MFVQKLARCAGALAVVLSITMMEGKESLAHGSKAEGIVIEHPWARETINNAPRGAGYMVITNTNDVDDRLVGVAVDFAGKIELHQTQKNDGVMKMVEMPEGIPIPAKRQTKLEPGGLHIMFFDIEGKLEAGDVHKAILTFENAGEIEVELEVEKNTGKKHGDHGHNH